MVTSILQGGCELGGVQAMKAFAKKNWLEWAID